MSKRNLIILLLVVIAVLYRYSGNITDLVKDESAQKEKPKQIFQSEIAARGFVSPHKKFRIESCLNKRTFILVDLKSKMRKTIKLTGFLYNIDSIFWAPDEKHFVMTLQNGIHFEYANVYGINDNSANNIGRLTPQWPGWDYGSVDWFMESSTVKWLDNSRVLWVSSREHWLNESDWIYAQTESHYIYSVKTNKSELVKTIERMSICRALTQKQIKQISKYMSGLHINASFKKVAKDEYFIYSRTYFSQAEMNRIIKLTGHVITKRLYDDGDIRYFISAPHEKNVRSDTRPLRHTLIRVYNQYTSSQSMVSGAELEGLNPAR